MDLILAKDIYAVEGFAPFFAAAPYVLNLNFMGDVVHAQQINGHIASLVSIFGITWCESHHTMIPFIIPGTMYEWKTEY